MPILMIVAPLLEVPPASRGEPSQAQVRVSPASRGEPSCAPARFPLRAGGTLRRGLTTPLAFVQHVLSVVISCVIPTGLWAEPTNCPPPLGLIRVHRLSSLCAGLARFFALTPSPSPTLWERGVGRTAVRFPLSRLRERGTKLKGVGFLRACLLAEPPNRVFLTPCGRDARAPSTRNAGNAGVPPAIPTAREKTYPFKRGRLGGGHVEKPTQRHLPIAKPKSIQARMNENPLLKVPPARRGNLKEGGFVNSNRTIDATITRKSAALPCSSRPGSVSSRCRSAGAGTVAPSP